jgi:hypothetical protein
MEFYRQAINNLNLGIGYTVYNNDWENIQWAEEISKTTLDKIEVEAKRLKDKYEYETYARIRARNYPPIGDQLDALYHAGLFPKEMADKIKAVKEQFPKPELLNGN